METALVLTEAEWGELVDICADWMNSDVEPKRTLQLALAHRIIDTLLAAHA